MKFTPKSEDDFQQERDERASKYVWLNGSIVDYEIKSAIEKVSKKGNEMIEADIDVYNHLGEVQTIRVWLGEWNLFLIKHICEGNDLGAEYKAGQIYADDLVGKVGKAKLNIQKGAQKEDGTFYSDRNGIADFLLSDAQEVAKTREKTEAAKHLDDIPFDDAIGF